MQSTSSLHKAALLLRSLDSDSAAVLLAQLSPAEAKAVRMAMRDLREVDPDEQAALRDELRQRESIRTEPEDTAAGVELELSTLADGFIESDVAPQWSIAPTTQQDTASPSSSTEPADATPFAWLEGGDLPRLAEILEREHISTVAVVLSNLPPSSASELLRALPRSRRAAALERLADLGDSDRTSLEVVEKGLAAWIEKQKAEQRRRADRMDAVQAILKHSPNDTANAVLADIADRDSELAKRLGVATRQPALQQQRLPETASRQNLSVQAARLATSFERQRSNEESPTTKTDGAKPHESIAQPVPSTTAPSFAFERLTELNQSQIAELFGNCPADKLVLALAGSSETVTKHVQKRLPKSVAKELSRRIHQISAIRLSDVTRAQHQIASTATRLFGSGAATTNTTAQ